MGGDVHGEVIDKALKNSTCVLAFIGPEGRGPWQTEEIYATHWHSVMHGRPKLVPVVLPGAALAQGEVPGALRSRTSVHFSTEVTEERGRVQLLDAILPERRAVGGMEQPLTAEECDQLSKRTIAAYNNKGAAEHYYELWKDDLPLDNLELFLRHISGQSSILDAGCGPGHHSHFLAKLGHQVQGIDLSHASLAIATADNSSDATFDLADMRHFPSDQRNKYDAVWCCASIAHVPVDQFDAQLRQFARVLRPGGILGLTLSVGKIPAIEPDGRFF